MDMDLSEVIGCENLGAYAHRFSATVQLTQRGGILADVNRCLGNMRDSRRVHNLLDCSFSFAAHLSRPQAQHPAY